MTICSGSDYFWADAHPFLIVCKPRPVVRVRVRRCVVRIRIRDPAIGVTVVVRPTEHTTVRDHPPLSFFQGGGLENRPRRALRFSVVSLFRFIALSVYSCISISPLKARRDP